MGLSSPFDTYFGFIVMLSELEFGTTFLIGFNVKLSSIPLIIITIVATVGIHIPNLGGGSMVVIIILLHLVTIAGLIYIALAGPRPYTIGENNNH